MKYFIKFEDETRGPFTVEQIKQRIAEEACQASDLVRLEERDDWTTLGALAEFSDALASQTPPGNPLAKASLLLALGSALLLVLTAVFSAYYLRLPYVLTGLGAMILGHRAIRRTPFFMPEKSDHLMARCGQVLGCFTAIILPFLNFTINPLARQLDNAGRVGQAINNSKQIIIALRLYAGDHDGKYPDAMAPHARSSNEVFHLLFKEGILETERIFGCSRSPFLPDGNIGTAPDFLEALKPGENHWAMTKGLNDAMNGCVPLVFENPSEATWPPKWNADFAFQEKPGRVWWGGKIVVGFNDTSVEVFTLEKHQGKSVGLRPDSEGKPVFPVLDPKLEILNVAK